MECQNCGDDASDNKCKCKAALCDECTLCLECENDKLKFLIKLLLDIHNKNRCKERKITLEMIEKLI